MKSKFNPFIRSLLITASTVGLAAVSVQADVLLTDNFNTAQDGANFNAEPGLSNDQSGGTLEPVTSTISYTGTRPWTVRRGFTDGGSYLSEMAVIGNGAPYGDNNGFNTYSSLNRNFAGDANPSNALLEVKFNIKVFAGRDPNFWGAVQIGNVQNAFITGASNKFASLFRDNGATEQWKQGSTVGNAITFADGDLITMTLSNAAGTGSAFFSDGATDVAKIYVNNTLVGTWTNLDFGSADGFITFASSSANLAVDNLVITTVPGPSNPPNDGIWTAGAGNWSDTGNWLGNTVAQGTDRTATFNGASPALATVDSVISIGSLQFSGADHTIAAGAGSLVLQGASPTISVGSGRIATIATNLYGMDGMQKSDSGKLVISGSSAYTGTTIIQDGTLELQNSYASSSFSAASGAVLEMNVPSGSRDSVTSTFSGQGTLRKTGAGNIVWGASSATFAFGPGAMIDVQEGSLTAGSSANEVWSSNLSDLNVASGASFNTVEANVRVNQITGSGTIGTGYSGAGYVNLAIGVDNGSSTFDGVIQNTENNPGFVGNLVKEGTGTITLNGANTYTGNTSIIAGTLVLSNACLNDDSTLSIASGASIELNHGLTDVVGSLVINGTPLTNGTYTSSSPETAGYIIGSGAIQVHATPADPLLAWIDASWPSLSDKAPAADPDNDGISNLLEYVLKGGDPSISNPAILPTLNDSGTDFVFSFYRRAEASGTTQVFELSPSLDNGSWTSIAIPGGSGVTVTAQPDGSEKVEITVAKGSNSKLFGRLKVTR